MKLKYYKFELALFGIEKGIYNSRGSKLGYIYKHKIKEKLGNIVLSLDRKTFYSLTFEQLETLKKEAKKEEMEK